MAEDAKFRYVVEGVDANASASIDKVVDRLNKAKEATKRWNEERAKFSRQERQDKFRQLSDDQKIIRLQERQIQLEQRLARARQQGNNLRASALQLSLVRNTAALRGVQGAGSASGGGSAVAGAAGGLAALGSRFFAPAAIGAALLSAVRSTLRFADEMSDLAEQMGITRDQVVSLSRAAGAAGVSTQSVFGALSQLSSARNSALSGDANTLALFKRYGLDPKEENIVNLAQKLAGSLGSGGMLASDRDPLGKLLGRRPEGAIAAFRSITGGESVEKEIAAVDRANAKVEEFFGKLKIFMVKTAAGAISLVENATKSSPSIYGYGGGIGGGTFLPKQTAPNESPAAVADVARTAATEAIKVVSNAKTKAKSPAMRDLMYTAGIEQASGLARTGFSLGKMDPEGSGLMRKQIEILEKQLREAKESKAVLQDVLSSSP